MSKFAFQQGNGTEKVYLDGEEIGSAVTSLTIRATPGKPAAIELNLVAIEVETEIPGHDNEIRVTQATADLLQRYGWTPPASGFVACKTYTTEEIEQSNGQEGQEN